MPRRFALQARRAPAASDTRLFEKTEAKILLKAPELPREGAFGALHHKKARERGTDDVFEVDEMREPLIFQCIKVPIYKTPSLGPSIPSFCPCFLTSVATWLPRARADDGLVHLPTVPLLAAGLALFVSTGFKMRDNRMKTAVKREENSKQLLEDVKAYNAAKKAAD